MTTPESGGFDYTDDSVIARVSFDIPPSTVTDISQITQVMGAMRTQLEAVSRAQSDWLDYLQQVPQIAERANQAFRDQITLMERMSYLQSEIGQSGMGGGGGGGYGGGGGGGAAGGGGAGGGAPAGYSTAAPSGYEPHWKSNEAGMGTGVNVNAAMAQVGKLVGDDRAAGEMMASRGIAINPAILGTVGGAIANMYGQGTGSGSTGAGLGVDTGGADNSQPTQSGRNAAAAPNPAMGGVPGGSADPNQPNAGAGGSGLQQLASQMWGEFKNFGTGARGQQILNRLPGGIGDTISGYLGGGGGGGGGGGVGGGPPGAAPGGGGGGFRSLALNAAKQFGTMGTPAKVGLGLGGAAAAFNMSQNIGERITRLQGLGSQEGGDYATGLKEDFNARFQALDPFINTDQARKAISMPMMAGFQGESRDTLRDELITNFKELGITFADSMKMAVTDMRGVELTDENVKKARTSRDGAINVLKEMAGDGGNTMALEERAQQMEQMKAILNSLGVNQESAQRSAIATQAGFDDSMALRGEGARITGQTLSSSGLMSIVGNKVGLGGILPEAMPAALADAGIDSDEARDMAAVEVARMVSGLQPEYNRIAAFMRLMGEQGVELDYPQAKDLYKKVSGDKSKLPSQVGNKRAAELGDKNKQTNWNPITGIADTLAPIMNARSVEDFKNLPGDVLDGFMGRHEPSRNAERVEDSFQRAGRIPGDQFAPSGQKARALPQSMNQVPQEIKTQGQVSGNVTITVDQQGRATAPPTIQLTGTQKAVNAGVGSAQLNNPQASEPRASNTFPGG